MKPPTFEDPSYDGFKAHTHAGKHLVTIHWHEFHHDAAWHEEGAVLDAHARAIADIAEECAGDMDRRERNELSRVLGRAFSALKDANDVERESAERSRAEIRDTRGLPQGPLGRRIAAQQDGEVAS